MLAGIFSKDARWFLDENTEVEVRSAAARARRPRGHAARSRHFCSRTSCCRTRCPNCLSQTGTTGRQFAQLLIRVWQETRHNNFPDIERAAEECGKRQMPLTLDAVMAILQAPRLGDSLVRRRCRKPSGALVRSRFEAPGTVLINKRLRIRKSG